MPHVWPDAVRQRGDVPLGYPGGTFRHQGMLEFIQRQIGGRAGHGPVASAANHAWHRSPRMLCLPSFLMLSHRHDPGTCRC